MVVLNRRGLENLNIELTSDESVDITDEYLIIKNERAGQTNIYGLWVFREPPPSSTSHHPEAFSAKVNECIERAGKSKKRPAANPHEIVGDVEVSVPMGRQISLRQLFGQQRQEDDTWSVRSHSPSHRGSTSQQDTVPAMASLHIATQLSIPADTNFNGSAYPLQSIPLSLPAAQLNQSNGQQQRLLDLFRRAKEQTRT